MPINIKIAWRNIWRNPRRTILTISAIAFATFMLIFMLSLQFGAYSTMVNASVKIHTGHLQIQAKGYQDKQKMRLAVSNPEEIKKLLDQISGLTAFTYRANAIALVSSNKRTYGVMIVGISPEDEAKVSTIKNFLIKGAYLSKTDTSQALVGDILAQNLQIDTNDELVILGQGKDGSIAATVVVVKGIYSSGQDKFDRSTIHLPIKFFNQTFSMDGAVHKVVAICNSLKDVPHIKQSIIEKLNCLDNNKKLSVLDWMDIMPGLTQGIKMDLAAGVIFYCILLIVVSFSILNTFTMSILERKKEFGVLLSIGTTPGRLIKLLQIEVLFIALSGILVGITMGCCITLILQNIGLVISNTSELMSQYGMPNRIYPQLSLLSVSIGPVAVLLITSLTTLFPILKIQRLKPSEALSDPIF